MKNLKWWIIAILLLALAIRLPGFGQVPTGLNRDEAALGYNAWSLWRSGQDEHGVPWPVSLASFGDQKLPGYVYVLIPFVATLGTGDWVVKLPSLLAGLAAIGLVGRISWYLVTKTKLPLKARYLPLVAMFLVAISPWGNHFSRVAYEAHLAMVFFLGGLVAWLEAQSQPHRERWWWLAAAGGFSLSMLTYHSYQILVPLMVVGLTTLNRRSLTKYDRPGILGGLMIGGATLALLWFGGVWSANQTKLAGINPFAAEVLADRWVLYRQALPGNTLAGKLIANRWTETAAIFGTHLVETLSTNFLFTSTTDHHVHNQTGIGNLHLFIAPFLLIGLAELWRRRASPIVSVLWLWLLCGLVAPSLTIAPQHTIRLSPIFPLLEIGAAIGLVAAGQTLTTRRSRLGFGIGLSGIIIFSILRYEVNYLVIAPQKDYRFSEEKWSRWAVAAARYQNETAQLIVQSPASSPYIWYLWKNRVDPRQFRRTVEYYPVDDEGFRHVKSIGNLSFETIHWDNIWARAVNQRLILFLQPTEISLQQLADPRLQLRETITDHTGQTIFWVVEAKAL